MAADILASNDTDGKYFYAINISLLGSFETSSEWIRCLDRLTILEKEKVQAFLFFEDKKRAMASLLLQKLVIRKAFNVESDELFRIERTIENKPFLRSVCSDINELQRGRRRLWNYNVSHHGDFVAIITDNSWLIGLDIVDITTRLAFDSVEENISMFRKQLTESEYCAILSPESDSGRYKLFFLTWALKESYIKAIGQGLGFPLNKIDFAACLVEGASLGYSRDRICNISATIAGRIASDWRFDLIQLDPKHVVAIARGPWSEAISSFKATLMDDILDQSRVAAVFPSIWGRSLDTVLSDCNPDILPNLSLLELEHLLS